MTDCLQDDLASSYEDVTATSTEIVSSDEAMIESAEVDEVPEEVPPTEAAPDDKDASGGSTGTGKL